MPDRLQPGERYTGHRGLVERFGLHLPLPSTVSIIGTGRRTVIEDGRTIERYPASYDYGDSFVGDVKFAVKNEPLDLRLLNRVFSACDADALAGWVRDEPTGAFSRRGWFLYEHLTGRTLDVPDAGAVKPIPVLAPERHIVAVGEASRRHRVLNNLLGTPDLCPTVRRTPRLLALMGQGIADEAKTMIAGCGGRTLTRAINYLYTKETKSSFAIEHESASGNRAERFINALRSVKNFDLGHKESYVHLQNIVVDSRYAATDWRDFQNFIGETIGGYREEVHYICPKPQDVEGLMRGVFAMARRLIVPGVDPVAAAALVAFAFVFVHPFEDGNGRVHRFLIHRVLSEMGMTPPGLLFPVSAVMVRDRPAYDAALESFSAAIHPFIDWGWSNRNEGEIFVRNETRDLYRFFDATPLVEYLYGCVIETVRKDLREEIDFVAVYDRALAGVKGRVDMPDKRASLLTRLCLQNGGRLAAKRREDFAELTDDEIADIEATVAEAMGTPLS